MTLKGNDTQTHTHTHVYKGSRQGEGLHVQSHLHAIEAPRHGSTDASASRASPGQSPAPRVSLGRLTRKEQAGGRRPCCLRFPERPDSCLFPIPNSSPGTPDDPVLDSWSFCGAEEARLSVRRGKLELRNSLQKVVQGEALRMRPRDAALRNASANGASCVRPPSQATSIAPSTCLLIYPLIYRLFYFSVYCPFYCHFDLPFYLSSYLSFPRLIFLSIVLSIASSIFPSIVLPITPSNALSIYRLIYRRFDFPFYPLFSVYRPFALPFYLSSSPSSPRLVFQDPAHKIPVTCGSLSPVRFVCPRLNVMSIRRL